PKELSKISFQKRNPIEFADGVAVAAQRGRPPETIAQLGPQTARRVREHGFQDHSSSVEAKTTALAQGSPNLSQVLAHHIDVIDMNEYVVGVNEVERTISGRWTERAPVGRIQLRLDG